MNKRILQCWCSFHYLSPFRSVPLWWSRDWCRCPASSCAWLRYPPVPVEKHNLRKFMSKSLIGDCQRWTLPYPSSQGAVDNLLAAGQWTELLMNSLDCQNLVICSCWSKSLGTMDVYTDALALVEEGAWTRPAPLVLTPLNRVLQLTPWNEVHGHLPGSSFTCGGYWAEVVVKYQGAFTKLNFCVGTGVSVYSSNWESGRIWQTTSDCWWFGLRDSMAPWRAWYTG